MAGRHLTSRSRRVVIKSRLIILKKASPRTTAEHLRYIAREGVTKDGAPGKLYNSIGDDISARDFEELGRGDRHQFRFIVSPEDGVELGDLKAFTRQLMSRMESDLGTKLEWVAVDHWDTDDPHTHVVVRGKDEHGKDLIIASDYITHGMRARACELATEWLGERTDREIQETLSREVAQQRWTSLDRELQRRAKEGKVELRNAGGTEAERRQHAVLTGRCQTLAEMGLAESLSKGIWRVRPDAERILRTMGERGDIIRTMQRAMGGVEREIGSLKGDRNAAPVIGRISGKGLEDELKDVPYLVVDGIDGRAHYVSLPAGTDLKSYSVDGVVEVRWGAKERESDRTIARMAEGGVYRTDRHLEIARKSERNPKEFVKAHVRRLEALRRAGIVERVDEGVWRVPADLVTRGQSYDAGRSGGLIVEMRTHLPIEQQKRALGVTWLDRQLLHGDKPIAPKGFGAEVHKALNERVDFLVEEGLVHRKFGRVYPGRNLFDRLRGREMSAAVKAIERETGLKHQPVVDGQRVAGIYRKPVNLVSARFAMLQDGMGFSLVPWRPVIEKKIGKELTAVLRGDSVSWEVGRRHELSL
jgi:type IV secretory pathway VirD2 relaxase